MNSQRRFKTVWMALLFVALSSGLLFAQYQGGAPAYDQDQAGAPAPPMAATAPPQDDSGQQYPAPQQPYPGQQQPYPGQQQPYPGQQQYPSGAGAPQQDPPGRVARVEYMDGQVSIQPGGVNDWIAASQNRPLTTSDRVWTDKESRAELNIGDGFIRMNSETSLTLTSVSDNNVQLELDQGTLEITVRHLNPGEIYEVDTPNYAFTVMKSGVYRFDVYPNEDQSWVTVRSGEGTATGRGAAVRVKSGSQIRFTGGNSLQHTAESAPARDGFDDWAQVRDKRLDSSLSAQYVSPGVIGYQDLDQYGSWQPTPLYGNVWVPTAVPVGWAPYRYGHWVWIAPWGWTWVDDAPWGFAPFHYGRWVVWGGGWAWAPGPIGYWNPYYAPALVGWIGGPGFGIGFGFPGFGIGINFGWFPLGWGEPFYPRYCGWGYGGWYRGGGFVTAAYFNRVNITNTHITNVTNITNNYYSGNVNATHYGFRTTPGAVTAAPSSAFASGAAINRVGGAVPKSALGQGSMLRGVSLNPTKQSVLGGKAPETRGTPPSSAFSRSVITANRPSTANRPANLETANQQTLAHGNLNALNRGASSFNNASRPSTSAANTGRTGGNTNYGAQSHGPATSGSEARLDTTPTSMGGHYVPRPPSAGGVQPSGTHSGATGATNNNYGHGTNSAANRGTTPYNNQHYGSSQSSVPRPPQSTQPSHGSTPTYSSPHQSSSPHSSPKSSGHESSGHDSSGHSSLSVPHPPADYSYHAAPTYSASAGYGASRPLSGYAGNRSTYDGAGSDRSSRSYGNGSSSPYSARSYGSSPAYSNRSYGSNPTFSSRGNGTAPTYSARNYGSSPSYSNRSTRSYSAPHYSGGASSRSSSGGGHSSGGHGR